MLTHQHMDHIGLLEILARRSGAEVAALSSLGPYLANFAQSAAADDLSFSYFPESYRWSHGVLIGLNSAPWGGAEIGEVHRIGLRLRDHVGDDKAWFREWSREAEDLEKKGRAHLAAGRHATAGSYLRRAANYYHVGERFLQPKSEGLEAYRRGVDCFREAAKLIARPRIEHLEIPFQGTTLPALLVHP